LFCKNIYKLTQKLILYQAEPRFRDKKRFVEMADPTLDGEYPTKGLYQALAIAAMCLQEEAGTRPVISDVVTALEYLAISNAGQSENTEQVEQDSSHHESRADGNCHKGGDNADDEVSSSSANSDVDNERETMERC
jgi:hypothetical protein